MMCVCSSSSSSSSSYYSSNGQICPEVLAVSFDFDLIQILVLLRCIFSLHKKNNVFKLAKNEMKEKFFDFFFLCEASFNRRSTHMAMMTNTRKNKTNNRERKQEELSTRTQIENRKVWQQRPACSLPAQRFELPSLSDRLILLPKL